MEHILHPIVTIVGAGEIGTALGGLLEAKGTLVNYWDRDPAKIKCALPMSDTSLSSCALSSDFIFLCIPASAVREVTHSIGSFKPNTVVLCLAKGIEPDSLQTMDEVLVQTLPADQPFALLYGPMLAEELVAGLYGVSVVATSRPEAFEAVQQLFSQTTVFVEYSSQVHSVVLAGILKNVYSVALGIAEGLGWGENAKGWLVAQAFREMEMMYMQLGEDPRTITNTALLGDFIATGFSSYSRNHQIGMELVSGQHDHHSEGEKAMSSLARLLHGETQQTPIFRALLEIIENHQDAKQRFEACIRQTH